jgi:hypothetical protein
MQRGKPVAVFAGVTVLGLMLIGYYWVRQMDALDRIVPTVEHIRSYEELAVFHVKLVRIIPIELNVDTNRLEYDYETTCENASEVFEVSDAAAKKEGWTSEFADVNTRRYSRLIAGSGGRPNVEVVEMTFLRSQKVKIVNSLRRRLSQAN